MESSQVLMEILLFEFVIKFTLVSLAKQRSQNMLDLVELNFIELLNFLAVKLKEQTQALLFLLFVTLLQLNTISTQPLLLDFKMIEFNMAMTLILINKTWIAESDFGHSPFH